MAWEFAKTLFQHGVHQGSRSTVVSMLGWMAALLAPTMLGTVTVGAPAWMQYSVGAMFGLDFVAFLLAFFYFAFTNPDALRSERFSIQKLAIERGILGDSISGLFEPESAQQSQRTIEGSSGQGGKLK